MDWTKVVKALDDEWHNRQQLAMRSTNQADHDRHTLLANIAFMLRDCLVVGISAEDRKNAAL